MFACEKAVALAPEDGNIRDSRGLARTLIGDKQGAIEDFQAFIKWTDDEALKAQRQRWIDALKAGRILLYQLGLNLVQVSLGT